MPLHARLQPHPGQFFTAFKKEIAFLVSVFERGLYIPLRFFLLKVLIFIQFWEISGQQQYFFIAKSLFIFTKLKFLHRKVANHELPKNDENGTYRTCIINFVSNISSIYIY